MKPSIAAIACLTVLVPIAGGCPSLGSLYRDRGDIVVDGDVAYIDDGRAEHRCDLYRPLDATDTTPVVVFFHGGYWQGQDKQYFEFASGLYGNVGVALGREGMRVANCNYRLFPEVKLDGMLEDVDAAVTFFQARFPRAPIALMGHSAGAHLASAATSLPTGPATRVDARLLISGIFDIVNAVAVDSAENREQFLLPLFGETAAEQQAGSTIDTFASSAIPTLVVAGTADLPGIIDDFARLQDTLGDRAGPTLVELDGADHAGTVLQIGTEDDLVTPAVVDLMEAAGLLGP